MKALTIDAYWAWAIIHGAKRVENRSWRTNYRGPLAIHAGRTTSRDAEAIVEIAETHRPSLATPEQIEEIRGKIIGVVELVDCCSIDDWITLGDDPFASGPFCWLLDKPTPIDPIPVLGTQGIWVPPHIDVSRLAR